MALQPAYEGEDVPIVVNYTDDSGNAVTPDGAGSTPTGPTITITDPDGTEVVSAVVMTENTGGEYQHVWDTSSSFGVTGTYHVEVSGEFSSETKIVKSTIQVT